MKAVKVMATINEEGQLALDKPLDINKNSRVEVIVLISEELEDEQSPVYKTDSNSQQYIHPYLIDRVEPSVQHIIFSSYIKF